MTPLFAAPSGSVLFPLAPAPGESFKGYITRVAAHNGHASRYSLLYTLGVSRSQVNRLELDVEGVAYLYRQRAEVIAEMLPQHRGDGKIVLAGEVLSRDLLRASGRWVAPIVLGDRGVDLAQWSNKSRKFCLQSWTWLSNVCPGESCGAKLQWETTSLLFCLKCGADLRRQAPKSVAPGLRPILSLTYDLGSERWRRVADEHLPPELKGVSPEVLMDLIRILGGTLTFYDVPWGEKIDGRYTYSDCPSYSEKILRGCFALSNQRRVRDAFTRSKNTREVTKLRAKLRALSLGNVPLQEAIKSFTGIRCLSQEEQEQSITTAAAKLKIPRARLRNLILDGGVSTNAPSMGGWVRLYNEVMIDGLGDIINDRIPISTLANKFKIDRRIIFDLEESGDIEPLDGVACSVYRERQFKRSSSVAFFGKIESLIVRHGPGDGRILLSEVMARLPAGPKPWGSILAQTHSGTLEGELGSLDPSGLKLERLTLDHILAERLISGGLKLRRPFWPGYWRYATLRQAEDVLGLYPRDIKILQRIGLLEDDKPGTSWGSIEGFARQYVGTRELAAFLSIAPLDLGVEASKRGLSRVAPRVGAWERWRAKRAFGIELPKY